MTTVRITDAGGNKPTFVQWDVDRVVIVSGVTSQPMLHFANAELKRAIVVPTEETSTGSGKWKADVPNFILQFPLPIVISVFLQPEGGEGQTVATVPFGVRAKPKPQDYTYEENIGYINWVAKSEEVQDLIGTIQGMLDRGELKGAPFTYDDFTAEQLAALKGDPGDDGVSPTVSTEVTYYGNKVTFTDADGDHTINVLDGMTATVKTALLNLFQHVAYVDDQGQTYYDALYDAFNPVLNVDYITVVFDSGTAVIYNTYELAQLKPYLTVTAHYDDGTSAEVDTYTLSGTIAAGTDTITVTYGGKSAIFTVTVVEWLVSIDAVFTQGQNVIYDTDSLDTLEQYLVVTATYADSTTATVSDYTLSGTLTAGTSTITVSYGGKTDTFDVTVTTAVWYQLLNHTFANDGPVLTGINFMATDVDISIVADVDFAGQSTSSYWRLFTNSAGTSPYPGIYIMSDNNKGQYMRLQWMTDGNYIATLAADYVGNIKIVLTHKSGSDKMNYYYKIGNNSLVSGVRTAAYVASTVEGRIGGTATEGQFNGTVNELTVYRTVLSDSDISAFFS